MKKFISVCFLLCILFIQHTALAETVYFNLQSLKYHKLNCAYAKKCTKNCVKIEKQEAKSKGGVPCKVCGG